jgi:hypothetical protein
MKNKEYDYEGEMAKNTLRKLIVFSQELLPMIKDEQQLPAWLQDKFSKLDYYVSAVYSYMKFSNQEMELANSESEEEDSEESDEISEQEEMQLEIKLDDIVKK